MMRRGIKRCVKWCRGTEMNTYGTPWSCHPFLQLNFLIYTYRGRNPKLLYFEERVSYVLCNGFELLWARIFHLKKNTDYQKTQRKFVIQFNILKANASIYYVEKKNLFKLIWAFKHVLCGTISPSSLIQ